MATHRIPPSEVHRRPTPHPGFDVAKFARESERRVRAAEAVTEQKEKETPTGPPPAYHPASLAPPTPAKKTEAVTISPPLAAHLRECQSRIQRVRSELAIGSISREEAASVLRLELGSIATSVRGAESESLIGWLGDLRGAIEELGGIAGTVPADSHSVVVVDEDPDVRERIALAIESLGHATKSVGSLKDLPKAAKDPVPDILIVAAPLAGDRPDPGFAAMVRELARTEKAKVLVYTNVALVDHAAIARERGAERSFCPSASTVDALATQLGGILEQLGAR